MWHEMLDRMTSFPAGCDVMLWTEIVTKTQTKNLKIKQAAMTTNRIFSLCFYSFQVYLSWIYSGFSHYDWWFQVRRVNFFCLQIKLKVLQEVFGLSLTLTPPYDKDIGCFYPQELIKGNKIKTLASSHTRHENGSFRTTCSCVRLDVCSPVNWSSRFTFVRYKNQVVCIWIFCWTSRAQCDRRSDTNITSQCFGGIIACVNSYQPLAVISVNFRHWKCFGSIFLSSHVLYIFDITAVQRLDPAARLPARCSWPCPLHIYLFFFLEPTVKRARTHTDAAPYVSRVFKLFIF